MRNTKLLAITLLLIFLVMIANIAMGNVYSSSGQNPEDVEYTHEGKTHYIPV